MLKKLTGLFHRNDPHLPQRPMVVGRPVFIERDTPELRACLALASSADADKQRFITSNLELFTNGDPNQQVFTNLGIIDRLHTSARAHNSGSCCSHYMYMFIRNALGIPYKNAQELADVLWSGGLLPSSGSLLPPSGGLMSFNRDDGWLEDALDQLAVESKYTRHAVERWSKVPYAPGSFGEITPLAHYAAFTRDTNGMFYTHEWHNRTDGIIHRIDLPYGNASYLMCLWTPPPGSVITLKEWNRRMSILPLGF